ncbi:MAG: helix-turn-helix transcriptional regulator [Desulfarculaceae bacterium]|jgi:DNA-binding CsgD family transcriptional regulator
MPAVSRQGLTSFPLLEALPYAILDNIKDPVQVIDREYRIIWCNNFYAQGREWDGQDFVGKICYQEIFQRQSPCPDCPLNEAFATGRSAVKEKIIPATDGSHHWREVHSYPISGPDGLTAYVVKIGFDITPKKREQGRLEKYLSCLENSLNGESGRNPGDDSSAKDIKGRMGLTGRELEVLRLIAEGFTNANIANILKISPNTVKTHVGHVFDKLGVGDRAQAAVWAARNNLV